MVPYREAWMPQVDTMKTLQGWSDVTITHFRDLGVYGEQILLSIRYHNWNDINDEEVVLGYARLAVAGVVPGQVSQASTGWLASVAADPSQQPAGPPAGLEGSAVTELQNGLEMD